MQLHTPLRLVLVRERVRGYARAGTVPFYSGGAVCTFLLLSFLKHERTTLLYTSLHAAANPVFILCALPGLYLAQ